MLLDHFESAFEENQNEWINLSRKRSVWHYAGKFTDNDNVFLIKGRGEINGDEVSWVSNVSVTNTAQSLDLQDIRG